MNPRRGAVALNPYQYARWNPVRLVDPDGAQEVPAQASPNEYDPVLTDLIRKEELRIENVNTWLRELDGVEVPVLLPPVVVLPELGKEIPDIRSPVPALKTVKYVYDLQKFLGPFIRAAERAEQYNTSSPAPPSSRDADSSPPVSIPGLPSMPPPSNGGTSPSSGAREASGRARVPDSPRMESWRDAGGVYHFVINPPQLPKSNTSPGGRK